MILPVDRKNMEDIRFTCYKGYTFDMSNYYINLSVEDVCSNSQHKSKHQAEAPVCSVLNPYEGI